MDNTNNLYIVDRLNHRVLAYDAPLPSSTLTITRLSPSTIAASGEEFTLAVEGMNFASNATARWNGADRPTTLVSSTQLTAEISVADLAAAGAASITVFNPAPGGGASNAQMFAIRPKYLVYLPLVAR